MAEATTFDALLDFVKQARGFDFTGYKRSSVERRVAKRMADVGVEHHEDYIDYLQLHSAEFAELFNTLLINTTGFFRDPQTWEKLATEVIPRLVATRPPDAPLRVWSAGCSSGEEAYTVAMVMARVLGVSDFCERVKIFATDIDEQALDHARPGAYEPRQVENIPRDALERFFEQTDQRFVFRTDLRRCVIFGRNDLVQDAPISHIDLLVCRNTIMYFTAETQAQILRRFHFALDDDDGVLLLGKSEMLIRHADLFTPIDLKWRLFRKVMGARRPEPGHVVAFDPGDGASQSVAETLREAAFEISSEAQVVLDANGALIMANDRARRMFALGIKDFGRPIQDLELSYRPVELRRHLEALRRDLRAVDIKGVQWGADRERAIDVRLAPLLGDRVLIGTSISYVDVTESRKLQEEVAASRRELEEAYEELQSTVEELETTNEELQSTNEELETTNEELQSTNEELETMNEELQSSNEELGTMNDELRHRTLELDDMNAFLDTILTTIGLAIVVVDRRQRIQVWNGQARELWGLTSKEVENQHVQSLDIGLPLENLKGGLRSTLEGEAPHQVLTLPATNRRGRAFQCRVTLLPVRGDSDGVVSGAIMMMEPDGD